MVDTTTTSTLHAVLSNAYMNYDYEWNHVPSEWLPWAEQHQLLQWWAKDEYQNGNREKAIRIQRVADRMKMIK